jgi:hypothetical protein
LCLIQPLFLSGKGCGVDLPCRCRSINVVGFREAIRQQRLQSLQCVAGLFQFSLRPLHARFRCLDLEFQLSVLRTRNLDLLVESREGGLRLFQRNLVIGRINFEEHISGGHGLIVLHVELADLAAHARSDTDDVGARGRVVCPGVPFGDVPDPKSQHGRSQNHDDTHNLGGNFAPLVALRRWCCLCSIGTGRRVFHGGR